MVDPSTGIDGWKAFEILSGIFVTFLGFIGARALGRLDSIERNSVTKADLETILQAQAKAQSEERREMREDRQAMHTENKATLREFKEETSDRLERIDTTVQQVALQVARIEASADSDRRRDGP